MTILIAKNKYPWTLGQASGSIIFGILTVVALAAELIKVPGVSPIFLWVLVGLFAFITLLNLYMNLRVKNNSRLTVEMNTESLYYNAWFKKPAIAVWGDKMNRTRNQGNMKDLKSISYIKVGYHNVFQFKLADDKNLYLPERGAYNEQTAEFFNKVVVEHFKGTMNYGRKSDAEAFMKVLSYGNKNNGSFKVD
jgi:hypothetical protein